jgi:quercetin dioxygenase-like cupin family protein
MGTVEVLSVLAGHLSLRAGSTELELAEGDTVMFEAHAPHRYGCVGTGPVRFTMVVLQPGDAGLVPPTSIAPASPE